LDQQLPCTVESGAVREEPARSRGHQSEQLKSKILQQAHILNAALVEKALAGSPLRAPAQFLAVRANHVMKDWRGKTRCPPRAFVRFRKARRASQFV
jgi:hypothetical protein